MTTHKQHKFTNQLIHESSPYLLQHAHNPVDWYPWGEEALKKAREENKLMIISIGYSACHWCHVMEHESFEDEDVAAFMNKHFVSIKVDREERPDIDQVYMNAVQLLTGQGGWPLNCIALPDGRPIYGGTYFTSEQWIEVLRQVNEFVQNHPDKTEEQAQQLTHGIQVQESAYMKSGDVAEFNLEELKQIFSSWKRRLDFKLGGTLGAPKFPLPGGYQFLLFYHYLTGDKEALEAVTLTLTKMAGGGIYDQVGGGFARYATDEKWKVPHFEKMLYDNAQLVSLYSKAYQSTKIPLFKKVVTETLTFIERELTSDEGGFYSALDADSEGIEGKYYVWSVQEFREVLGEHADLMIDYYNLAEGGNWENGINILFTTDNAESLLEKYKLTAAELEEIVDHAKEKLLAAREKRVYPGLDDKILTSWNALMIQGYIDAYNVFGNRSYLDHAVANAEFLKKNMFSKDYQLFRNYKNGKASIHGFLDDYAFTISAYISLYQATFDENWLNDANRLCASVLSHFYDDNTGMLYYTSDTDPKLVARKMEIPDNVIPSASSEMAKNLYLTGKYFNNDDYILKSKRMLNNVREHAMTGGEYYSNWDNLHAWFARDPFEVAIIGPEYELIRQSFEKYYLPDVFLMGGRQEGNLPLMKNKLVAGQTTIYVCRNKTCKQPVTTAEDALKQILND
ncbi:MAG: thioredoxin domain-containing protein [Candidatus Campbellbacteria bacterium]|nr:thioredoxin domain-containing protein [Candidatus Campbellbacteria bacterium]